jgi:hypothetical protein
MQETCADCILGVPRRRFYRCLCPRPYPSHVNSAFATLVNLPAQQYHQYTMAPTKKTSTTSAKKAATHPTFLSMIQVSRTPFLKPSNTALPAPFHLVWIAVSSPSPRIKSPHLPRRRRGSLFEARCSRALNAKQGIHDHRGPQSCGP